MIYGSKPESTVNMFAGGRKGVLTRPTWITKWKLISMSVRDMSDTAERSCHHCITQKAVLNECSTYRPDI